MKKSTILFTFVVLLLSGCDQKSGPKTHFVSVGTGGLSGVYYPVGQGIAKLITQAKSGPKIKGSVESTAGSVFNINAVMAGNLSLGVAQSDRQYLAYHGQAEWKGLGKQTGLRSIAALHPEAVTLVVAEPSGIKGPQDLKGKRINLGNPGSGQRMNSADLLAAYGLSSADLDTQEVKAIEAPGLLQDERIDGFFYTVGHPNGNLKEASSGRVPVRFIPLAGPQIDQLLKAKPYYAPAVIFTKYYPNALGADEIPTFGVKATLISSDKLPLDVGYKIAKVLYQEFDQVAAIHPSFGGLKKEDLLKGLSAPLHPGAYQFYKEMGMSIPDYLVPPHVPSTP